MTRGLGITLAWLVAAHGAAAAEQPPVTAPPPPVAEPRRPAPPSHVTESDREPAPEPGTLPPRKGPVIAVAIGPGLFRARSGSSPDERRFRGETLSFEALFGGRVVRRFALGAAFLHDQVFGLRASDSLVDGDEPDMTNVSFSATTVALFGDFTLLHQPELHVLGYLGSGGLSVNGRRGSGTADIETPSGLVYAIAFGCEYRVAERVTLGGRLRVTAGSLSVNEFNGTDVDVIVPALLAGLRFD